MESPDFQNPIDLNQAIVFLKEGEVVALPTETVYGLAAKIDNESAVKKIFQLKQRPFFDPLIIHCLDSTQAKQYIDESKYTSEELKIYDLLWTYFSPGPLTIVLQKNKKVLSLITAGQETVAIRIPKHDLIQKILKEIQSPLAAPSANIFNKLSPTKAKHVISAFKSCVPVVDGGDSEIGLESTIIRLNYKKKFLEILRPGIIGKSDFEKFLKLHNLNYEIIFQDDKFQPGGSNKHYLPDIPLIILKTDKPQAEISSLMSDISKKFSKKIAKELVLEKSPDLAARSLYQQMRDLSQDKDGIMYVIKNCHNSKGNWKMIWDRLQKACSEQIDL